MIVWVLPRIAGNDAATSPVKSANQTVDYALVCRHSTDRQNYRFTFSIYYRRAVLNQSCVLCFVYIRAILI